MSLSCQKPKSRFLRLMSEFQKSTKRGGSLVVETGFPTSLIDLFVKNRDRLKKSSSKRFKRQTQTAPNASLPFHSDATLEKPAAVKHVSGVLTAKSEQVMNKTVGINGECVLMVLMVLVVAVLALSTKKTLTVGITLSTFALLLTEIAAERVFTRSKICNSDTQKVKPVVKIHDKNVISCKKVEAFHDSRKETRATKPKETEPLITEKSNLKYFTIRDLLQKDEKSKSKSSRLKSKIVKKLRSYKKKKETNEIKEESLTEVPTLVPEIKESDKDIKESKPPLIGSKGDNMNGIVLIVIVLTGLLSGKILAIGLTLSCLFLRFKAAKKIWSL